MVWWYDYWGIQRKVEVFIYKYWEIDELAKVQIDRRRKERGPSVSN